MDQAVIRPDEGPVSRTSVPVDPGSRAAPVLGYASVQPEEDEHPLQELQQQASKIVSECQRLGLSLLGVVREREPKRGPC